MAECQVCDPIDSYNCVDKENPKMPRRYLHRRLCHLEGCQRIADRRKTDIPVLIIGQGRDIRQILSAHCAGGRYCPLGHWCFKGMEE